MEGELAIGPGPPRKRCGRRAAGVRALRLPPEWHFNRTSEIESASARSSPAKGCVPQKGMAFESPDLLRALRPPPPAAGTRASTLLGAVVQREDTGLANRQSGFDSPPLHRAPRSPRLAAPRCATCTDGEMADTPGREPGVPSWTLGVRLPLRALAPSRLPCPYPKASHAPHQAPRLSPHHPRLPDVTASRALAPAPVRGGSPGLADLEPVRVRLAASALARLSSPRRDGTDPWPRPHRGRPRSTRGRRTSA